MDAAMNTGKKLVMLPLSLFLAVLISCGSNNNTNNSTAASGTGTVSLYLTGDTSTYQKVNISIHQVTLINSGTQHSCKLLASPVTMDITELADIMELAGIGDCSAGIYNRIGVQLEQQVSLVNSSSESSSCRLAGQGVGSALSCDPLTGLCSYDLSGAVRRAAFEMLAGQVNNLALDFELSRFSVSNFGNSDACSLTIEMAALQPSAIISRGDPEALSGRVSGLDTAAGSFTLKSGHPPFLVNYRNVSDETQPGIDQLLQAAQDERFRIRVTAEHINVRERVVDASALSLTIEGTVSGLDPSQNTLMLTHKPPDRSIHLNYEPPARVLCMLEDEARIAATVYGYDSLNDQYLASLVRRLDKDEISD
jgi:hypothetical protein